MHDKMHHDMESKLIPNVFSALGGKFALGSSLWGTNPQLWLVALALSHPQNGVVTPCT